MVPMPDDPSPLERYSTPLLVRLSRLPRWLILVAAAALLLTGLLLENAVGGVLLLLLAAFLAWLAVLGWSRLQPAARLLRLLTIGLLVFAGASRIVAA
jgi:uncharacterized membrane protein